MELSPAKQPKPRNLTRHFTINEWYCLTNYPPSFMSQLSWNISILEFRLQKTSLSSHLDSLPNNKSFLVSMKLLQKLLQSSLVHDGFNLFALLDHIFISFQEQSLSNPTFRSQYLKWLVIFVRSTDHHSIALKPSHHSWLHIRHHYNLSQHILRFVVIL